jgi:GNAT superfamily N-acetyltransferase
LIIQIQTPAQLADLNGRDGLLPLPPDLLKRHEPNSHWVLLNENQAIAAYCSLWWNNTPPYLNHRLGVIGHYATHDAESAGLLLNHACQELGARDCTMAVGPMDGNTWRRYRLLSQRGTEPIFFLEPDNPSDWCDQFRDAGFIPLATYSSALTADLSQTDPRLQRVEMRLQDLGVEVRSLNLQNFQQELQHIYQLSLISFRHNFLYTPIEAVEFVDQYSQIRPYVQPDLVLMAEHNNKLVGFLFAIPDLLQAKRGELINTVIIKTVAVLPGRLYAGLGNVLVARVQAIAHQLGYTRAIHALMHDANNSRNLSSRYAHTIRRYTLFAKELVANCR